MKIGIHGINGKMGLAIATEALHHREVQLVSASVRAGHPWAGKQLREVSNLHVAGLRITANLEQLCAPADVIIDFTRPDATQILLPICRRLKKPLMIGTTGFNATTTDWISKAATEIPIVLAANTSVGVTVLLEVSRRVAQILAPDSWDVEIFEAHHRNKVDAPSGTALRLGQTIAEAQNTDFESRKRYPYSNKRKTGEIGFSVQRAGDIVGDHSVSFINDLEALTFSHHAQNRRIFAQGAIRASQWLRERPAGLYSMAQVLGFEN